MLSEQAQFALEADIRIIAFEFICREIFVAGPVIKSSIRHFGENGTGVDHGTANAAYELQFSLLKKRLGPWFSTKVDKF